MQLRDRQQRVEQVVHSLAGHRRGSDDFDIAAPFRWGQTVLGHLRHHAVAIDALQVNFVERHDNGHFGRFGVGDRFGGLRHDAVVRGDDEHRDVGDVGPAGPHFGERFVARRVNEGDLAIVGGDLVGPNVLGDPAGFTRGDVDAHQTVQQRRFAVVDVAQERHDRRPRLKGLLIILAVLDLGDQLVLERLVIPQFEVQVEFRGEQLGGLKVNVGVDVDHHAMAHENFHDLRQRHPGCLAEAANGRGQFQLHFVLSRGGGIGALSPQRLTSASRAIQIHSHPATTAPGTVRPGRTQFG